MLLPKDLFFSPEPISAVQNFFGEGHSGWFQAFSLIGDTWGVLLAIGLSWWLWRRDLGYEVLFVVVLAVLTKEVMNLFVTVPRPSAPSVVVYEQLATPSFPSGHVLTATAVWGVLYARRRIHLSVLAAIVIAVCLGRIYLGAHYLIDVIAGAAAGAAVVWAAAKSWDHVRKRMERLTFRWMVAAGGAAAAAMSINLVLNRGIAHRWAVTGVAVGLIGGMLFEHWASEHRSTESSNSGTQPPSSAHSPGSERRGAHPPESSANELVSTESFSRAQRVRMVAAGVAGITAGYAVSLISANYPLVIDMGASFATAFWIVSGVPLLFGRSG